MNERKAITLVLLVAAFASGWAVWTHRPKGNAAAKSNARSDYVLTNFEVVVLDKTGLEAFTVAAPKLERNPGDRTMTMATPIFYIPVSPGEGLPPTREAGWEVRSKTGWVSGDGDELRLTGNVTAQTAGHRERPVTMATEQLNVFPHRNRATSPVLVTVSQPGSILRGQGMEALLDSKRIRFSSNVKVQYVPPPR
ncbi:LPS export ABC transporter periplasmic protein LptC [Lysobacter sp. KIS68-7]|uniref:LPS export ABC transporter periplasmic protein LptC n=1 Tax=Lysobacter sp. KIS68-7 TaxID=2904252 RepID=UPI001E5BD49A|nr:LPS export ABC transporter periplasmic protein LptC [Lysobacter sp. KIS68-7]UHQ19695.1 LPS export ABC transporter periplasmic protein LptC [Lysobacter sp. KIS68-7]